MPDTPAQKPDLKLLEQEIGAPTTGTIRPPERSKTVAGILTPAYLGALLRQADLGNVEALHTLSEEIPERDGHISSVVQQRVLAVSSLPGHVSPGDTSRRARKIAEDCQETLVESPLFEGLVTDLMSGILPGFAAVEILWNRKADRWVPREYAFRSPRHFVYDRETLSKPRIRTTLHPTYGEALDPFKWVVHTPRLKSGSPLRRGLIRPLSVIYACKKYALTDLLTLLDVYGIPVRIGKYPSHMQDRKDELLRALQMIGTDAAGVIPSEMDISFVESSATSGADSLYLGAIEYWDKQASKVVLSQTMTTDDGSSRSQSETHMGVRSIVERADARQVANTIASQLFRPFVVLNYGEQEQYPRLSLHNPEVSDAKAYLEGVAAFLDLGGTVRASEVREKVGLSAPQDGEETLQRAAPVAPAQPGQQQFSAAFAEEKTLSKAAVERTTDTIDEIVDESLSDWRPLVDDNIGVILKRLQSAESYEETQSILAELMENQADALDVAKLTTALAKSTFQASALGDATDETQV